jgi:hypothetical protein
MVVEIAHRVSDIADMDLLWDGIICCSTATETQRMEIIAIATYHQTPTLILEPLLRPYDLIGQVTDLIKSRPAKPWDGHTPA